MKTFFFNTGHNLDSPQVNVTWYLMWETLTMG